MLSHKPLPQCCSFSLWNFLETNNHFQCAQKHHLEQYFPFSISQICSPQKEKGIFYVFLVFVVCHCTAFWEHHKYALFSPIFLLSHYFLSTFFAIFLSFISSSVISPIYLSCTLTILFSVPSLYSHIWVNLSFLTSHFLSLLLSSPTFSFTFISSLMLFSTFWTHSPSATYMHQIICYWHECICNGNWVFINSSELLTTEAFLHHSKCFS